MPQHVVGVDGEFRTIEQGRPRGWSPFTWSGKAEFGHEPQGYGTAGAVRVRSVDGADAAWTRVVPVEPFSTYELTVWIRTEDVRKVEGDDPGARINLHARPEHTAAVTATSDWIRQTLRFETGADDAVQINCLLGWFGRCTGTAWFSNLALHRLSGRRLDPEATIGGPLGVDPISPYIYSQFIEHLGRCIQGGIWAEMLEDRKFLHPVGSRESPWRAIGAGQVEMDPVGAFVNDRSPRVTARTTGAGLSQRGLALERGRSYDVRAQVRGEVATEILLGGRRVALAEPSRSWRTVRLRVVSPVDSDDGTLEFRAIRAIDGRAHVPSPRLPELPDAPPWSRTHRIRSAPSVRPPATTSPAALRAGRSTPPCELPCRESSLHTLDGHTPGRHPSNGGLSAICHPRADGFTIRPWNPSLDAP